MHSKIAVERDRLQRQHDGNVLHRVIPNASEITAIRSHDDLYLPPVLLLQGRQQPQHQRGDGQ